MSVLNSHTPQHSSFSSLVQNKIWKNEELERERTLYIYTYKKEETAFITITIISLLLFLENSERSLLTLSKSYVNLSNSQEGLYLK